MSEFIATTNENGRMGTNELYRLGNRTKGKLVGAGRSAIDSIVDKALVSTGKYLRRRFKDHFGFQLNISTYQYPAETTEKIAQWLMKVSDKIAKLAKVNKDIKPIDVITRSNISCIIKLEPDTYIQLKTGKETVSTDDVLFYEMKKDGGRDAAPDLSIYFFGKHSYEYYRVLSQMLKFNSSERIVKYMVSGSEERNDYFTSIATYLKVRDMETLFYQDEVTENIIGHIERFLASESIYKDRDILYKTGILLYGEPGTGKTSLTAAIATKYNLDMIVLDMPTFEYININALTNAINSDSKMYLVVLEDIDCVIKDREDESIDKEENKVVNKLLQFLDSNSSPTNVIFIATTNHVKKLDKALSRKGRFDLVQEIGNVDKRKARLMCESFDLPVTTVNMIIDTCNKDDDGRYNQSDLQAEILKYIEKKINADGGSIEDAEE